MDNLVELLQRRLARERLARKQAEQIFEEKSRELYIRSQELQRTILAERQARGEIEIMLEAFEAFTAKLEFNEIAAHLEAFIKRLMSHDRSEIYFFEGEALRRYSAGGDSKNHQVVGKAFTPKVLLSDMREAGCPILISHPIDHAIASEWGIHPQTKTWMVVLMSAQGRKIGCITIGSRETEPFCVSMARLVQAIANEAAIAFENARLFQEVRILSTVDPLTGLYNRRHFNASARVELQRAHRYELPLSAIMMDIDHFKGVNDTHGHAVGDRVLVAVADVCRRGLRTMDLSARYGGEEFCFLLPETPMKGALVLAERLRSEVAGLHFGSDKGHFVVNVSFGVAERLDGKDSVEDLLNRSDQALYEAKDGGRNRVSTWVLK